VYIPIINELRTICSIDIYIATPPDQEWMGMPIHGSAGLELGLIKKFSLPWNMRNAGGELPRLAATENSRLRNLQFCHISKIR